MQKKNDWNLSAQSSSLSSSDAAFFLFINPNIDVDFDSSNLGLDITPSSVRHRDFEGKYQTCTIETRVAPLWNCRYCPNRQTRLSWVWSEPSQQVMLGNTDLPLCRRRTLWCRVIFALWVKRRWTGHFQHWPWWTWSGNVFVPMSVIRLIERCAETTSKWVSMIWHRRKSSWKKCTITLGLVL